MYQCVSTYEVTTNRKSFKRYLMIYAFILNTKYQIKTNSLNLFYIDPPYLAIGAQQAHKPNPNDNESLGTIKCNAYSPHNVKYVCPLQ